jgi:hypothetical protein
MMPWNAIRFNELFLAWAILANGCAYRFTNEYITRPSGIKTVAFESIYDTSRFPVPHEVVWEALQRELARSGYLVITSRYDADALIRIHITDGTSGPNGTTVLNGPERDPEVFGGGQPPRPSSFRPLAIARSFSTEEGVSLAMTIDVWDLKAGQMISSGGFSKSTKLATFGGVDPDINFVRFEDRLRGKYKILAQDIAQEFVRTFFVR